MSYNQPHNPAASYDLGVDAAQQWINNSCYEGGGEIFTIDFITADLGHDRTIFTKYGDDQLIRN